MLFIFTWIIFWICEICTCDFNMYKLPIEETPSFQGFTVRKLTSDKLYFANLFKDYDYSLSTKQINQHNTHSICAYGTLCPAIRCNSTGGFIIKASKQNALLEISSENVLIYSNNLGYNMMGLVFLDIGYFSIGTQTSDDSSSSAAERTFFIFNWKGNLIGNIPIQTHDFGIIATSPLKLLVIVYYSKYTFSCYFCYAYYNISSLSMISGWNSLDNVNYGAERINKYYQIVEVANSNIIGCALAQNKTSMICFSGNYGDGTSFSIVKGFTTVIDGCQENEGFSFAKLGENTAIVSCGKNELKMAVIDINLNPGDNIFVIKDTSFEFLDAMVYNSNILYIIMSRLNTETSNYAYYADYLFFNIPSGPSIITNNSPFLIKSIFPTDTSFNIMITDATSISNLYSNDIPISLNTQYNINTLSYKPSESISFIMKYTLMLFDRNIVTLKQQTEFEYTFITCAQGCISCTLPRNNNDNKDNCISCDISNHYYASEDEYTDDQGTTLYNCYNDSNHQGYYLNMKTIPFTYSKCYETCNTCKLQGNSTYHKCLTCKNTYFSIETIPGNCENDSTISTIDPNYSFILDPSTSTYKQCAFPCKTCSLPPSNNTHYCTSCKDSFTTDPLNPLNCIPNCDHSLFYINSTNEYSCTDDASCPSTHPLLVVDSNQCVSSCLDVHTCAYCKDNFPLYEHNNTCVKSCPNGMNASAYKCKDIQSSLNEPVSTGNVSTYAMPKSLTRAAFKENIDSAIATCFLNADTPISSMQGSNYEFNFYSSSLDKATAIDNGVPYVNLQECESILRSTYNIPSSEELFIGQIQYDNNTTMTSSNMQYEVYRESDKTKVDMTPCNDIPISISKPLDNVEGVDFALAETLNEHGIDIFNRDDPIFNDRCTTLSLNGKDVSMETRQGELYAGVELCEEGCSVKEMDYGAKVVECECASQQEGFDAEVAESEIMGMVNEVMGDVNLDLFLCYVNVKKMILEQKAYRNVGCLLMGGACGVIVVLNVVFLKWHISAIYTKLNKFLPYCPPCPIYAKESNEGNNKDDAYEGGIAKSKRHWRGSSRENVVMNCNSKDKDKSESRMLNGNSNKSSNINGIINTKQPMRYDLMFLYRYSNNNSSNDNDILKVNPSYCSNNEVNGDNINLTSLSKQSSSSLRMSKCNNNNNNNKLAEIEFANGILNTLQYREALRKDNRSFCKYYFEIFIEKQIILSTILNNSIFYPLSLRISLLLFTLSTFFFINALLFTEEYITKRYSANNIGFVYMLQNELSKSMYSSIIGMFIGKFVNMILSSEIKFAMLIKSEKDGSYLNTFKELVNDMKKKFIIVIVVSMILMVVYWYFIIVFCYIYQNNQKSWIESSLFSIGLNVAIPVVVCFVIAVLRIVGLRRECGFMFNISVCLYSII